MCASRASLLYRLDPPRVLFVAYICAHARKRCFFRKTEGKGGVSLLLVAEKKKKKLEDLTIVELKKVEPKLTEEVLKVFNLKNSINSKKSYGGTAFANIKKMILKYKKKL